LQTRPVSNPFGDFVFARSNRKVLEFGHGYFSLTSRLVTGAL
jgi:hypothetical protein